MPAKRVPAGSRYQEPSYASSIIGAITSPENRSVITSLGLFAAGVAFLHSSWSEILLPA